MFRQTSAGIFTAAVRFGLASCSGSDSEVAELREELEDLREQLDAEESSQAETTTVPQTTVPQTTVPQTTVPQTFFEYPKYDIAIDFSTGLGAERLSALTQCEEDWETILAYIAQIEDEACFRLRSQMTRAELDFAIETFESYELDMGALLLDDSFLFRLGNCDRLFSEIFDTPTGDPVAMFAGHVIGCAALDSHEFYDFIRAEPADTRDYLWATF